MTGAGGDPRRLRELEAAPGSAEDEARTLLRAAEPHAPTVGSKARVRAALRERRGAGVRLVLRPALALLLVVASGAAATGTSLGRRWLDQGYQRLVSLAGSRSAEPVPRAPTRAAPSRDEGVTPPALVEPPAPPSDTPASGTPAPRRLEERPARHVLRPQASPVGVVEGDDPEMVAAAVRALRRDHDAARAGALLDTYVRRWPNGALVEEAMALAIEAAQAQDQGHPEQARPENDLKVRALANRYLQRFPTGRFGETAHRALARPAP